MPYKANAPRRHKFPKARYRINNWPGTVKFGGLGLPSCGWAAIRRP
jgi:hypothetical protein